MTLGFAHQAQPARPANEDDINLQIGKRIRRRRRLMGMTQSQLSHGLGLKFQQIQKYECAANKVCAARLFRLADKLQVPVQYFFDGLPLQGEPRTPANDRSALDAEEFTSSKEAHDLIDAYFRLPNTIRRKLREFAKALGEERE